MSPYIAEVTCVRCLRTYAARKALCRKAHRWERSTGYRPRPRVNLETAFALAR